MHLTDDIIFWLQRFYEHFHYLAIFIEKNWHKLEDGTRSDIRYFLLEPVHNLEKAWYAEWQAWSEWKDARGDDYYQFDDETEYEEAIDRLKSILIPRSIHVYHDVENAFKVSKIACIPDLVEHMIEETQYVYKYILDENSPATLLTEIAWWTKEHVENIKFISCELPRLVKLAIAKWNSLPEIAQILYANNKLANHFEELNGRANHLMRRDRNDLNNNSYDEKSEEERDWEIRKLYHETIAAKIKHLEAIKELMGKLHTLPLTEEDRLIVIDLLDHEYKEAIFAYDRIEHFYSEDNYLSKRHSYD